MMKPGADALFVRTHIVIMRSLTLAALVMMLTAVKALGAPAPPAKMPPYRLSRNDMTVLATTACTARYGVKEHQIKAWQSQRDNNRSVQAHVECTAHRTYPEFDAYHTANCELTAQWNCDRGETRIRGTAETQKIDIGLGGHDPNVAYQLVNKIAAYRWKTGDAFIDTHDVRCDLTKGPSKELLNVTCKDQKLRISYWCPQSSCPRIFSVNGFFVPADAGGL